MGTANRHFGPTSVIAGGAGFIGSHLAEILVAQGQRVIALDNYLTGTEENLKQLFNNPNFTLKIGDINQGLPEIDRVDYIFHLAGLEAYLDGKDVSMESLLVSSVGTRNLLELAKKHRAKILLASSTDIYSGLLATLAPEINREGAGELSYEESKRFAETLTSEYFRKFGVDARIVRLRDVYGPRMDLGVSTPLAKVLSQAIAPPPKLELAGEGLEDLRPTYVSDVVYGMVKAVGEGTEGKIYQLINPEKISLLSLAHLVKSAVPDAEIIFTRAAGETRVTEEALDSESAKRDLGWRPTIGLDEGIRRTLTYFKSVNAPSSAPIASVTSSNLIQATTQNEGVSPVEKEDSIQSFSGGSWLKRVIKNQPKASAGSGARPRRLAAKLSVALALIFIGLTAVLPTFAAVYHSGYGAWQMRESLKAITSNEEQAAVLGASQAVSSFEAGVSKIEELTWLSSLLQLRATSENYRNLILAAKDASVSAKYLALAIDPLLGSPAQENKLAQENLNRAEDYLILASSELESVEAQGLPGPVLDLQGFIERSLEWLRHAISQARLAAGGEGQLTVSP